MLLEALKLKISWNFGLNAGYLTSRFAFLKAADLQQLYKFNRI